MEFQTITFFILIMVLESYQVESCVHTTTWNTCYLVLWRGKSLAAYL